MKAYLVALLFSVSMAIMFVLMSVVGLLSFPWIAYKVRHQVFDLLNNSRPDGGDA